MSVEQRGGEIDAVLCNIVEQQGFDLKTPLGMKVLGVLTEVYDAVPSHTKCDLVWEPIRHALACACLRPRNGCSHDCDCDPDVHIRVEGLQPDRVH